MIEVSQEQFEEIVGRAIDALPEKYGKRLDNVAFVTADVPTPQQRTKMHLRDHETLYGLYEGIPQTVRGGGYSLVLPDKITIFKRPIEYTSNSVEEVNEKVRKTVWHEVAHHFGLDHDQIDRLGGS
jgi:predicted Zn-dependent protease with MMP-like domain